MSGVPPGFNSTLLNEPWLCTYATCPVSIFGQLRYIPSLAGNVFYLALFAVALLLQIGLGIHYRTWGYLVGLTIGPALFSAAIYLCLARIIAVYGNNLSWLSPKFITCLFIACDLV